MVRVLQFCVVWAGSLLCVTTAAQTEPQAVDYTQVFSNDCQADAGDRVGEMYEQAFYDYCLCTATAFQDNYNADELLALGLGGKAFDTEEAQACYTQHLAPLAKP